MDSQVSFYQIPILLLSMHRALMEAYPEVNPADFYYFKGWVIKLQPSLFVGW